ncbi:MAG: hypothetical protein ABI458_03665 [Chloroflexota bacterium]
MRHLRLFTALLAVAAITAACSSTPNATSVGQSQGSQPSTGSQPSQAAASAGGGGGGGGANGSITYEITGDYQASGELPFLAGGISLWVESANGWVANFANPAGGAVISLNTQQGQTIGQGLTYGDGSVTVIAASDAGGGTDCTFTLEKNDADGLKGHVECSSTLAVDNNTGAQKSVKFTAAWDAHP